MPFTFSHPAAILPARYLPEKWISVTALVIGSITPDFEYFIRMKNLSIYSHNWSGLLWYDLPMAFALTFIYHLFVRDGLIGHLPLMVRQRLTRYKGLDWISYVKQHFLVVQLCLIAGIATHIAWDGFTHRTGCFAAIIPWLKENTIVKGVPLTHYYILQAISSVVGMTLVLYALYKTPKDETIGKRNIIGFWFVSACITLLIVIIRAIIGEPMQHLLGLCKQAMTIKFYTTFFNHPTIVDLIMTIISAFLISLIVTPGVMRRLNWK